MANELNIPIEENVEALKWFEKYQAVKAQVKILDHEKRVLQSDLHKVAVRLSERNNEIKELQNLVKSLKNNKTSKLNGLENQAVKYKKEAEYYKKALPLLGLSTFNFWDENKGATSRLDRLDKELEIFANDIAIQLASKPTFDIKEAIDDVKGKLYNLLEKCLQLESSVLEQQKLELRQKLTDAPEKNKERIQNALGAINFRIKEINILNSTIEDKGKYKELLAFVKVRLGEAALEEFFIILNECREANKNKL